MHCLVYFCIVIFSAESSGLETAPSLAEWCKWFELCRFSLLSCSIFCLMPRSHFLQGLCLNIKLAVHAIAHYGAALMGERNGRLMLTIFLCVYIKVGGHPGGLSEWNLKWVTLALQTSLHYIQQSYCLLLQRHIAHLLFMPQACIHPQPICLSILSIVISLQPELCCITATVIHQRPPSCALHGACLRHGMALYVRGVFSILTLPLAMSHNGSIQC